MKYQWVICPCGEYYKVFENSCENCPNCGRSEYAGKRESEMNRDEIGGLYDEQRCWGG